MAAQEEEEKFVRWPGQGGWEKTAMKVVQGTMKGFDQVQLSPVPPGLTLSSPLLCFLLLPLVCVLHERCTSSLPARCVLLPLHGSPPVPVMRALCRVLRAAGCG